MSISTYSYKEIQELIRQMLSIYDLVRLVDANECRELTFTPDGNIIPADSCYSVWDADQRCANCSSYKAFKSQTRVEKEEYFENKKYHILSNPIELIHEDGSRTECVMECITVSNESVVMGQGGNGVKGMDSRSLLDSLTGLYSWDGFYEKARDAFQNSQDSEWVLIIYNIVQFKLINDLFGIPKGDEVLMKVAKLLKSKLSDGEICGRLRGDQFAVLIHKDNFDGRFVISASRELPGLLQSSQYHLHIQAGVYYVSDKTAPISSMCDRANIALSTIKGETNIHVAIFNESIMDKMLHEQYVINECERAIQAGEFMMYLQPQVREDGHIVGAEALARWVRSNGKVVPPVEFIDILERSDLIVKLDTYIWKMAAKKLAEWKDTDKSELYISVNISPKDFFYIDVYEFFEGLVKEYDIDRSKLKLEITETIMMRDALKQLALVNKLHNEGFEIEIDDFGKGYSSLSLLKDINADTLKIDKEFLKETDNDKKSENILGSVIDMSDRLSMKVITEGVETKNQLDRLVKLGCHTFQGFYFAKPMPVEDFDVIWKDNNGSL